ncbi:hypothetical protein TrRE_jg10660 [Triparma retinervis]|uniref:Glycoside hydrolase family 5 domain-containing protein n=1 Tax=Triparma retinervis TaxID=2557542 RepID=A0A9W7DZL0_9STRA|nr:hypothetical protein TrRE_jg10660 [Triparma retinervis]
MSVLFWLSLLIFISSCYSLLVEEAQLPLLTSGNVIVGQDGARVKLACVNWYGPNLHDTNVVGGLEHQPMEDLVAGIVDLGFNCIRLPFTVEQALEDPEVPKTSALPKAVLAANPDLLGLSSLEIFDRTVSALTDAGLMIILNVHTSASEWCCDLRSYEGLWFTPEWTLSQFERSLVEITERYKDNALVVGMDLRNEIHDVNAPNEPPVPVGWGRGDPDLDWAIVSKRVGDLVLDANPDLLIVVTALCFAMDLRGCKSTGAISLKVPNKLVWTVHSYRFFTPYFDVPIEFGLKNYTELAIYSAVIFAVAAALLVAWRVNVKVEAGVMFCSNLMTYFIVMLMASAASWGAAETLKTICNTWYHADAKLVPPILFTLTLAVPVVVMGVRIYRRKRNKERDSGEMLELVNVDSAASAEKGAADEKDIPPGACLFTKLIILKVLVFLNITVIISAASLCWSLIATSPAVYANFNDRMWGFASSEDKSYTAPIWMSEFGADTRDAYWVGVISYLAKTDMDWAVWAYYGASRYEQSREVDPVTGLYVNTTLKETYGLMNEDYSATQFAKEGFSGGDWRIQDMQAVMEVNPDISGLDMKATDGVW